MSQANPSEQYQPFYCEENIWQLAQSAHISAQTSFVAVISNLSKTCAFWHQKAAHNPLEATIWDYHVILFKKQKNIWYVYDLDTLLGCPISAQDYLSRTFSGIEQWPQALKPIFRLIHTKEYIDNLSTNRSHMKNEQGEYLQPPPSWKAPYHPQKGHNLPLFFDMSQTFIGERLSLEEVRQKLTFR